MYACIHNKHTANNKNLYVTLQKLICNIKHRSLLLIYMMNIFLPLLCYSCYKPSL